MSVPTTGRDRAKVDVCDACGGVFLGYYDGEPSMVARALAKKLDDRLEPTRTRTYQPTCPGCDRTMELLEYLQDDGPPLFRCPGCMAAFVTPAQRRAAARFTTWTRRRSVLRRLWDAFFA